MAKGMCRKCYYADHYKKNVDVVKARNLKWRIENPEKEKARGKKRRTINQKGELRRLVKWQKQNPEKVKAQNARFAKRHPEKMATKAAQRRAIKKQAIPLWANDFFIEEIYDLANRRTKVMGFKWHVDHIVPLQHPLVCGLHCEQNLRVIPAVENLKKHNKYWPDMP